MTGDTPKPAWVDAEGDVSYDDIVKSWDFEIAAAQEFGSYEGDLAYVLKGTSIGVGLLVVGYGSCSGCDQLQATLSDIGWDDTGNIREGDWGELVGLAKELRDSVHWEATKEGLAAWVMAQPENRWWSYDREIAKWLNEQLGTTLNVMEDED